MASHHLPFPRYLTATAFAVEVRVPGMTVPPSTSQNSKAGLQRRAKRPPGPSDAAKNLLPWIWRYFENAAAQGPAEAAGGRVVCTNAPPLYLQYQGHSTSVVGIERRRRGAAPPPAAAAPAAAAPRCTVPAAAAGRSGGQLSLIHI